jgi:hypothetical protein
MFDRDLIAGWLWGARRRLHGAESDRGDVPGWVMVTVMTAAFVVLLIATFKDRIVDIVQGALDRVSGEGGP